MQIQQETGKVILYVIVWLYTKCYNRVNSVKKKKKEERNVSLRHPFNIYKVIYYNANAPVTKCVKVDDNI